MWISPLHNIEGFVGEGHNVLFLIIWDTVSPLWLLYQMFICFEWDGNQQVWLQVVALLTFPMPAPCHSHSPLCACTPHCFPWHVFHHLCIMTSCLPSVLKSASTAHPFINKQREAAVRVKRKPWSRFLKEGRESVPLKLLPAEEFPEEGRGQPLRQLLRHCLYQ